MKDTRNNRRWLAGAAGIGTVGTVAGMSTAGRWPGAAAGIRTAARTLACSTPTAAAW